MSCFLIQNIKLTLFGSDKNRQYENSKSPYHNFIVMCSLSCVKPDSIETKQLMNMINDCGSLHPTKDYQSEEKSNEDKITMCMQDIAKLQHIKLVMHDWYKKRKGKSSRIANIQSFLNAIQDLQNRVVKNHERYSFNNRDATRKQGVSFLWINPLHDSSLPTYLPNHLQQSYEALTPKKSINSINADYQTFAPKPLSL